MGEGKEGGKGREEGERERGRRREKEGREFASLALGGIDAPGSNN